MFSLNSLNSVTKIFDYKRIRTCYIPACYHSTSTKHVRDRNFKLNPIYASMIISFPEFAEFSESYAPFRKNSNSLRLTGWTESRYLPEFSSFVSILSVLKYRSISARSRGELRLSDFEGVDIS